MPTSTITFCSAAHTSQDTNDRPPCDPRSPTRLLEEEFCMCDLYWGHFGVQSKYPKSDQYFCSSFLVCWRDRETWCQAEDGWGARRACCVIIFTMRLVSVCDFSYVNNFFGSIPTVDLVHYSATPRFKINASFSRTIQNLSIKLDHHLNLIYLKDSTSLNWAKICIFGANCLWVATTSLNLVGISCKIWPNSFPANCRPKPGNGSTTPSGAYYEKCARPHISTLQRLNQHESGITSGLPNLGGATESYQGYIDISA